MCNDCISLHVPQFDLYLTPGCKVRLGRFQSTVWVVRYGWYSWAGNRPVCGWYLIDSKDVEKIRSLQKTDLDDIYLVES